MKARIEKGILIITLLNKDDIIKSAQFQLENNMSIHELPIQFDIDLRDIEPVSIYCE